MNYKRVWIIGVLAFSLLFSSDSFSVQAETSKKTMLVTYMTAGHEPSPESYLWEATFSAFAEEISFLPADEVTRKDVEKSEVVVFLGEERGTIPKVFRDSLEVFDGQLVAFGYNVEQLSPFDNWQFLGEEKLRVLDEEALPTTLTVTEVVPPEKSDILSTGKTLDKELPFISKNGHATYIATTKANSAEKHTVSRTIYDILSVRSPESHQAYIRLEDVSPLSNPNLLLEAGEYLIEREIPFYISVNPVYVNEQSGEYETLADNDALVEVLQYLQERGGMLIAHGYTKTYLPDEGEEGYEFWDIAFNQKITSVDPHSERSLLLERESFPSKKAYESYMAEVNEIERVYIKEKLSKAIEELVELELYPLSFEPPRYAMSISGYEAVAEHFSAIFGHLQLSDRDVNVTNVPLFVTSPAVTNRMKVYPETIGFVNLNKDNPLEEMEKSVRQLEKVPGSIIGGFYHSYLGAEYLPEVVKLIESVGPIEWVDLRETSEFVRTEQVEILSRGKDEALQMTKEHIRWSHLFSRLQNRPLEAALWGISSVVVLFLLAFFVYIAGLRVQLRKRLFEERETNG